MMAAFGLLPEDIEQTAFELWPVNWPAFCLFQAMSTQWVVGPCGATGMNYASVREVMKFTGIKKKNRPAVFADFQIMEAEALTVMDEQKPNKQ